MPEIKRRFPTLSQATVYKTLSLLKDMGQVLEIDLRGDSRYDGHRPEPHPHLICIRCDKIIDGEADLDPRRSGSWNRPRDYQDPSFPGLLLRALPRVQESVDRQTKVREATTVISRTVQDAVNEQINKELYSSYLYLSMAAYFEGVNLPGFAKWMHVQADEEREHGMKFFRHMLDRGGKVQLKAIAAPQTDWRTSLEVFKQVQERVRSGRDRFDLCAVRAGTQEEGLPGPGHPAAVVHR